MDTRLLGIEEARKLVPGSRHYRAFVGHPREYDVTGAIQFSLLVSLGLREDHKVLDIGCGSLCGGRLLIPFLLPGNYCGIDPEEWLIEDGIHNEVSEELRRMKRPRFVISGNFDLTKFKEKFDFIVSQSVMTHVSDKQLDRCLSQVSKVMNKNGLFAASFYYNGESNSHSDEWVYPAFTSFSPKLLVEAAKRHNLACHPLLINSNYGHTWMLFSHAANARKFSWIGDSAEIHPMLQILELKRNLAAAHDKLHKSKRQARQEGLARRKARRAKR